jgi:formyltetrahydrofolate-dependent phosphoribosylglycinamide formyltransferase
MATRVAVLASGRGTNLQALHEYLQQDTRSRGVRITLVLADRPDAGALQYAAGHRINAITLDEGTGASVGLAMQLREHEIDLVVLAGYLKMVPSGVVKAYRGALVNVHPALLPAFGGQGMYGKHVHEAVLKSGARVTGVTVHFVDEEYDHGPIIAQWPVPVFSDDTVDTLSARVLRVEHVLMPRAVAAVARKQISLDADGRVVGKMRRAPSRASFVVKSQEDAELATEIEAALAP